MFRISFVVSTLYVLAAMPALSWEVFVDKEPDGTTIVTAEQIAEGGAFFNLVCFEQAWYVLSKQPTSKSSSLSMLARMRTLRSCFRSTASGRTS